jgi:hypothetical protein
VYLKLCYGLKGKPLANVPYIARERFWQATPWKSGRIVEGIEGLGGGSIQGISTFTAGSSVSETESIAATITSEVGGEFEGISSKVSTSLTVTFSTTYTVSRSYSETFVETLNGVAGKRNLFVLWVLMERFSFVNADGTPFSDPNYEFPEMRKDPVSGKPYMFEIAGSRAEAVLYCFDPESGKLLETKTLN